MQRMGGSVNMLGAEGLNSMRKNELAGAEQRDTHCDAAVTVRVWQLPEKKQTRFFSCSRRRWRKQETLRNTACGKPILGLNAAHYKVGHFRSGISNSQVPVWCNSTMLCISFALLRFLSYCD